MMKKITFAAVPTPLDEYDQLSHAGLEVHLEHIWNAGGGGVLLGGSMGLMQLLRDKTWLELIEKGTAISKDCGEVLLGVGDVSTGRVLDRIENTNHIDADGVVVLTPYLWKFDDDALVAHYTAIANASRLPVYLYDLPALTGRPLTLAILEKLIPVNNIKGIKCSGAPYLGLEIRRCFDERFRVILAQPAAADIFFKAGYEEQLDGIYAFAPNWARQLVDHAEANNWDACATIQNKFSTLLSTLLPDVMPACNAIWQARGWPGHLLPAPYQPLSPQQTEMFCEHPIIKDLLTNG